jgi:hypothetical protein
MAIAVLGPNLVNTAIAVALVSWPIYARLVRAQAWPYGKGSSWRQPAPWGRGGGGPS